MSLSTLAVGTCVALLVISAFGCLTWRRRLARRALIGSLAVARTSRRALVWKPNRAHSRVHAFDGSAPATLVTGTDATSAQYRARKVTRHPMSVRPIAFTLRDATAQNP